MDKGDFNISLIETISYNFREIPHGMWVAGFVNGDGSFYTKLTQYGDTFHTGCIFKITLPLKDTALLEGLYDYLSLAFGAGDIFLSTNIIQEQIKVLAYQKNCKFNYLKYSGYR